MYKHTMDLEIKYMATKINVLRVLESSWNNKASWYFCLVKVKGIKVYENAFESIIITEEKVGL